MLSASSAGHQKKSPSSVFLLFIVITCILLLFFLHVINLSIIPGETNLDMAIPGENDNIIDFYS